MFESVVQPPAQGRDTAGEMPRDPAATAEAYKVNGDRPLGRRFSADDFRALTARVLTGAKAGPHVRSAPVSTIVVPDLVSAFRRSDDGMTGEPAADDDDLAAAGDQQAVDAEPETDSELALAPGDIDASQSAPEDEPASEIDSDGRKAPEAIDAEAGHEEQASWVSIAFEAGFDPTEPADIAHDVDEDRHEPAEHDTSVSATAEAEPDSEESALHTVPFAPADAVSAPVEPSPLTGQNTETGEELGSHEAIAAEPDADETGNLDPQADPVVAGDAEAAAGDRDNGDKDLPASDPHDQVAETSADATPEPASGSLDEQHRSVAVPVWHDAFVPDRQSGDTARMLLDIMAMPSGAIQPQERALAGDTLLRLVSRMPIESVISLCERLCIMETPPPLLVRRLVQHPNVDVAGPLLERCTAISDQDLMNLISTAEPARLRLIARRRHLSPALTDALIGLGDSSVLLTVVRNPGAVLSPEAFGILAEQAKTHHNLQAPLATRADTPAQIAFELFWSLPPELRRYVLSRFLTESATLDRILKIAHTLDDSSGSEGHVASRTADRAQLDELVTLMAEGDTVEAACRLAAIAGICESNALRIINDPAGEPLTVALKALGLSRTQFAAAAETLNEAPAAPLRAHRRISELKALFDSLSFTKARVLLTYWDWAVERSSPYSGQSE